jgi:hypothetical protein
MARIGVWEGPGRDAWWLEIGQFKPVAGTIPSQVLQCMQAEYPSFTILLEEGEAGVSHQHIGG